MTQDKIIIKRRDEKNYQFRRGSFAITYNRGLSQTEKDFLREAKGWFTKAYQDHLNKDKEMKIGEVKEVPAPIEVDPEAGLSFLEEPEKKKDSWFGWFKTD